MEVVNFMDCSILRMYIYIVSNKFCFSFSDTPMINALRKDMMGEYFIFYFSTVKLENVYTYITE